MKKRVKECLFCHSKRVYQKSLSQFQCVTCKRSWSEKKFERECSIIDAFIANKSALTCAKTLNLNYATIKRIYTRLRLLISQFSQNTYLSQVEPFDEYDEHYFLPQSKRYTNTHEESAVGILGMTYGTNVVTLLLPEHLKQDNNHLHRLTHVKAFDHTLGKFWVYFEAWISHFKGVKKENLIYYLKEAEFKFNHSKEEQKEIILRLWLENM